MNRTTLLAHAARLAGAFALGVVVGSAYRLDAPSAPARTAAAEPAEQLQHALVTAQQTERDHAQALREAKQACREARGHDAVMFPTPEGHLVCRRRTPAL